MRLIDADEVVKFYTNMGEEFMELSVNLDNIDTVKNVHLGGKTAMTKYSDIEIQTAKNMLKKGLKWIGRNQAGKLSAHANKPSKVGTYWWSVGISDCACDYVPIFQNIRFEDKEPTSLESIVHPQILDDAEREYLSAVIKPFRDRVKHICRGWYITSSGEYQRNLSIYITLSDDVTSYNIDLPLFKKETMYKGMKIGKAYTLEELGL